MVPIYGVPISRLPTVLVFDSGCLIPAGDAVCELCEHEAFKWRGKNAGRVPVDRGIMEDHEEAYLQMWKEEEARVKIGNPTEHLHSVSSALAATIPMYLSATAQGSSKSRADVGIL